MSNEAGPQTKTRVQWSGFRTRSSVTVQPNVVTRCVIRKEGYPVRSGSYQIWCISNVLNFSLRKIAELVWFPEAGASPPTLSTSSAGRCPHCGSHSRPSIGCGLPRSRKAVAAFPPLGVTACHNKPNYPDPSSPPTRACNRCMPERTGGNATGASRSFGGFGAERRFFQSVDTTYCSLTRRN